ncbi:MAG: hypothetical protein EOO60_13380 [Hymenobacter sp.]|nr:MAG: hypothetical protein EOO60_13380 [Hymenobacter sp.]
MQTATIGKGASEAVTNLGTTQLTLNYWNNSLNAKGAAMPTGTQTGGWAPDVQIANGLGRVLNSTKSFFIGVVASKG